MVKTYRLIGILLLLSVQSHAVYGDSDQNYNPEKVNLLSILF